MQTQTVGEGGGGFPGGTTAVLETKRCPSRKRSQNTPKKRRGERKRKKGKPKYSCHRKKTVPYKDCLVAKTPAGKKREKRKRDKKKINKRWQLGKNLTTT